MEFTDIIVVVKDSRTEKVTQHHFTDAVGKNEIMLDVNNAERGYDKFFMRLLAKQNKENRGMHFAGGDVVNVITF